MGYHHVLAAVDLSSASRAVIERAAQIAKDSNATLSVVHVIEHSPVAYGGEFSIPIDPNLERGLETESRAALAKLGKEFNIPDKNLYLDLGSVRITVIDIAKKHKVDLIVVGTHGHHGLDILLGSRANVILHHATCDVLAVRIKGESV